MIENRKKWIAALRSGNYQQGKARLNANGRLCCLGVACEVYQAEVGDLEVKRFDSDDPDGSWVEYDGAEAHLPYKVVEWLGVDDENPMLGDDTAVTLNDMVGLTFEQIADRIEANL